MLKAAQLRKWQSPDWTPYLWGSKALSAPRWGRVELSQQEQETQSAQMDMAGQQRVPQMALMSSRGRPPCSEMLPPLPPTEGPCRGTDTVGCPTALPLVIPAIPLGPHRALTSPRKLSPASTVWPASKS